MNRSITFNKTAFVLASLFYFGGILAQAGPLVLIEDGLSRCEIVLPPEASPVEKYAAKELQGGIARATGVAPSLSDNKPVSPGTIRIVLGTPFNSPEIAALNVLNSSDRKTSGDEILVLSKGETLFVGGSNPRSVLYSVYRFLEESLGFRWFWPGETGEFFQKKNPFVVESLELHEKAALPLRSLSINSPHYDEDTLVWMARNRMNVYNTTKNFTSEQYENLSEKGFIKRFEGHNLVLPVNILKDHPDYIAEYGGKRELVAGESPQLCWSNPDVQQALVKQMLSWKKQYPLVDVWSIIPADQTRFCQCKQCIAMAEDVSTRFQKFSAILITEARKLNPDMRFATLAYQDYRNVPQEVAPFEGIEYTSYNISYRSSLTSGAPANRMALREISEWQNLGAKIGLRAYEMIPFKEMLFLPLVSYEVDQLSFAKKADLQFFSTEVTPFGHPTAVPPESRNWDTNRMNLYALGRAMWTRDISATTIVDEWTGGIYGREAAKPMARYYFTMEKAWAAAPNEVSYFLNPAALYARGFISEDLIQTAEAAFTEADSLLKNEQDTEVRQRAMEQVAFEGKLFGAWKSLFRDLDSEADHSRAVATPTESSVSDLMDPLNPCWDQAPQLPQFRATTSALKDQTQVRALWMDQVLYLQFHCQDSIPKSRVARFQKHDDDVWADDSVEIFLNSPGKAGYIHLAVNSLGTRYDAVSEGGMNPDKSFNPSWSATIKTEKNDWLLTIALPLSEFGYLGREGENIDLSIMRSRPGSNKNYPNSGWPDAAYHSPASYGTIKLVHKKPKHIVLYPGQSGLSESLEAGFRKNGNKVTVLLDDENYQPNQEDLIFLRYGNGNDFHLSAAFMQDVILPWIEQGGTLIVAANAPVPFKKWFGREDLDAKWSGWTVDPTRRSVDITDGDWSRVPNDLTHALQNYTTPSSGFHPISPEWKVLATQALEEKGTVPYLMSAKIGSGTVFLTSSDMGYGGGFEMFGKQHPENAVKLIENLGESIQ